MRILIGKMLMQRYRSILHILDKLIEEGHSVCINRRGPIKYNPSVYYDAPWDISCCSEGTLSYLTKNFGLHVRHLDKVIWGNKHGKKYECPHKILCTDHMMIENARRMNIPYNHFFCRFTKDGRIIDEVVGNGMCEALKKRQAQVNEKKGQVLIIHPGGGRTIISPLRKHISSKKVIKNQISLFNTLLEAIKVSDPSKVVIKTHPAPYKKCDKESVIEYIIPELNTPCEIEVSGKNLLDHICASEFVITMGSSTVVWLLGSRKKWVNIIDCSRYDHGSPKQRDRQARADSWMNWPQNTSINNLWQYFKDYESEVWPEFYKGNLFKKYEHLFNMPFSKNLIRSVTQ